MHNYCRGVTGALLLILQAFLSPAPSLAGQGGSLSENLLAAMVTVETAPVYLEMSRSSPVVRVLSKGEKVQIEFEFFMSDGSWCSITEAGKSGHLGYVSGNSLERHQNDESLGWSYVPPPPDPPPAEIAEAEPAERRLAGISKSRLKREIDGFFKSRFGRSLPVSAFGQTSLHNRLGLDHQHSFDVAVHPRSIEGRALVLFLRKNGVPFIPFNTAVRGIATGPHIHVGRPSPRKRR